VDGLLSLVTMNIFVAAKAIHAQSWAEAEVAAAGAHDDGVGSV
jgi:hypothetical protein